MISKIETVEKKTSSNIIGTGKDLVALLRDLLLLVIALLLLFFPTKLNNLLTKAGFEEGSVVGFKWKSSLAKSAQALNESQAIITNLQNQLDSISIVLNEAKRSITDTALSSKFTKIEEKNAELNTSALKNQASVRNTISSNASLIKIAQVAVNENGNWGVVFSADASLKTANYEVHIAPKYGIPNVTIYYRQGLYRSVSIAEDRDQAEEILAKAKKRRPDAYIVPMSTWCPDSNEKDGYKDCSKN